MNHSTDNDATPQSSGDMAVIGEGTPNRTAVSIQVLQNIYHELTGKSEEVSKSYSDPFRIVHTDFEQLNHRVTQCCEQYNIKGENCSIKVFYVNDTQETFSSFERFRAFNSGSSSAVESVLLTYNFLIILPKLGHAQSYALTIRVASKVAIEKKLRNDMPFEISKILRLMGNRTAVVSVKYVDYAVARNILNVVDEWYKTVPKSKVPRLWSWLRKKTDYLPLLARYLAGALVALLVYFNLPHFLTASSTLLDFAGVSLGAACGIFAAYRLAHHLGSAAEDSIDSWSELSYVSLTAGDKREIEDSIRRNRFNLVSATVKLVGALLVSLAAKLIVALIVH